MAAKLRILIKKKNQKTTFQRFRIGSEKVKSHVKKKNFSYSNYTFYLNYKSEVIFLLNVFITFFIIKSA
jgi:hypothetical protein